jgi:branched-chain amino acid transport system permease protein
VTRTQSRLLMTLMVVCLAALPLLLGAFGLTLMNYTGIYALVALGLVLLTGVGGLTSFGQAAFVGIGAYATAWYSAIHGGSPWVGLVLALLLTGGVATILGLATLRLGGHLLPLSTIAWGLAIYYLFGNIEAIGSHNGISGIPPVTLGPLSFNGAVASYYLIWSLLGGAMLLCANLLDSREGRAIRSLRGGIAMAESQGIDTFRIRLKVFVLAGLLAGLSGWLYAHVQRYVGPSAFDVRPSIEYLFMAMLGGAGHVAGAVVGAAAVMLLKNVVQDLLPLLTRDSGQLEIVVFGALFILTLQNARAGIVPALRRWLPRPMAPPAEDGSPLPLRPPPVPGSTVLTVDGATKRFGGLVAVDKVGFVLAAGEILGLIGPNGAGKSTMFNLITGALKLDAGRIDFLGEDVTGAPPQRIAARGVARSFQHVNLRPSMTLLENAMLGAYVRTRSGLIAGALRLDRAEERSARADALGQLRRVGLADRAHDLAGSLPLGQQRLLEIARALAAGPILIVLDEPAAGLRHLEKAALAELLRALRKEGLTILLVEHDMEFVMGLVDRVVVMDFGIKLAEGAPAAIRADPRVQEAYLGGVA